MADIVLRFDVRLGASSLRLFMVAGMIAAAVTEVASENVTLTTYYPAPSGVYAQMITTGNTYLSRDGGRVGVGTASPQTSLDVNGVATFRKPITIQPTVSAQNTPCTPNGQIAYDGGSGVFMGCMGYLWEPLAGSDNLMGPTVYPVAPNTTYTAPTNGFLEGYGGDSGSGYCYMHIIINGTVVSNYQTNSGASQMASVFAAVPKGSSVQPGWATCGYGAKFFWIPMGNNVPL